MPARQHAACRFARDSGCAARSACANTLTFCDLVRREATGEVSQLVQAVVNLNRIEVAGVDAAAGYEFSTGIGDFQASLDAAYLDKYRTLAV